MVFIGYEPRRKAYKAYDPVTERVHILRDVIFDEQVQWDWAQGGGRGEDVDTNTFSVEMEYTTTVLGVPVAEELVGALRPLSPVGSPSPPLQPHPPIPIVTVGNRGQVGGHGSPPTVHDEDLDADHDEEASLQLRHIDDILGLASP
jgi:hypothetical protein